MLFLLAVIVLTVLNRLGNALNVLQKRQSYEQIVPNDDPFLTRESPRPSHINATKKELSQSNFKAPGAKLLTLWYKTIDLQKQTVSSYYQLKVFILYLKLEPVYITGRCYLPRICSFTGL